MRFRVKEIIGIPVVEIGHGVARLSGTRQRDPLYSNFAQVAVGGDFRDSGRKAV